MTMGPDIPLCMGNLPSPKRALGIWQRHKTKKEGFFIGLVGDNLVLQTHAFFVQTVVVALTISTAPESQAVRDVRASCRENEIIVTRINYKFVRNTNFSWEELGIVFLPKQGFFFLDTSGIEGIVPPPPQRGVLIIFMTKKKKVENLKYFCPILL